MASITGTAGLRGGIKIKSEQGYDSSLSKVVQLNSKNRIFFRIAEFDGVMDIIAATVPGRSLDYEALNNSFIPFTKEQIEVDDAGKVKDKTGLDTYARIATILHDAACVREKKQAENQAKAEAEELGEQIDSTALSKRLDEIEIKYHGGKASDNTRINPDKNPVISRLQFKITCQVKVVKLGADGAPDWDNAQSAIIELSQTKATQLLGILDDPTYVSTSDEFLEVGYNYLGADKKSAGKSAAFTPIAPNLKLAVQYPELWESTGKKVVESLVKGKDPQETAQLMKNRNMSVAKSVAPADVVSAFKKYCATNKGLFASIDLESDDTKRSAADFLELHLLDNVPTIKKKFEDIAEEYKKTKKPEDAEEEKEEVSELENLINESDNEVNDEEHDKKVADAINAASGNDTLKKLSDAVGNLDNINDGLGDGLDDL